MVLCKTSLHLINIMSCCCFCGSVDVCGGDRKVISTDMQLLKMTRLARVVFLLAVLCILYVAVTAAKNTNLPKCPDDKVPFKIGTSMVCVPKNYTLTEED